MSTPRLAAVLVFLASLCIARLAAAQPSPEACTLLRTIRNVAKADLDILGRRCEESVRDGTSLTVTADLQARLQTILPLLPAADAGAILDAVELPSASLTTDYSKCEAATQALLATGAMETNWSTDVTDGTCPDSADLRSLVFALEPGDSVRLVVAPTGGAPASYFATVARGAPRATLGVLVPLDAPFVYRQSGPSGSDVRFGTAYTDLALHPRAAGRRCVQFTVGISENASAALFLDGAPLSTTVVGVEHHAILTLGTGVHSLVAISERERRLDESIVVRPARISDGPFDTACQIERFDAAYKKRYSIERVSVAEACASARFGAADVHNALRAHMTQRLGSSFTNRAAAQQVLEDLRQFSTADVEEKGGFAEAFGELVRSASASRRGAARGASDLSLKARDALSELRRQGVSDAITVNVHCERAPSETVTFEVSKIQLVDLEDGGSARGLNLENLITTEVATAQAPDTLHFALTSAVDRLVGLPYARFSGPRQHQQVFATASHTFEVSGIADATSTIFNVYGWPDDSMTISGGSAAVIANDLDPDEMARLCSDLDNRDHLRGTEANLDSYGIRLNHSRGPAHFRPDYRAYGSVTLRQPAPGTALIVLSSQGGILDMRCVVVTRPSWALWLDASVVAFAASEFDGINSTRVRLGMRAFSSQNVEFDPVLSFSHSTFVVSSPPSWDAVLGGIGPGRHDEAQWSKSSVAAGAAWGFRPGDIHVGPLSMTLLLLLNPSISIGFIDASGLPQGIRTFDRAASSKDDAFDVDFDVDLAAMYRIHIGPQLELQVGYGVGAYGADDLIIEGLDTTARSIGSDWFLSIGPIAGFGWSL